MEDTTAEDGPREGETLLQWMTRRQAEVLAEAAVEPRAYITELSDWVEAHPDATFAERSAAFDEIKQKYPGQVEFSRKSEAWELWKAEHADARPWDKERGYQEIWGVEADESDFEEDPEFWEYDPDA